MAQFYKLAISAIKRETAKAVSITFDIPDHLKDTFKFIAGQYITLKTTINNQEVRRDYSLCTAPSSNVLTVAVKEVENGTFSTHANRSLKVGDTLEVGVPNGRFTFTPDASKKRVIAAFAAGSGITPIMSIAKTVLNDEPNSRFVLVYGNKSPEDTIFYQELSELSSKFSERFHLQEVFSQADTEGAVFGRIDKSTVNYALKNKFKDLTVDHYYLCGPEAMIDTVSEVLKEQGVSESQIHFELFTASSKTTEAPVTNAANGESEVTVIVDDEELTFTMSQKKTLLEASLANDVDAPYSCQGGICSSCIARVVDGEATMRQNTILTDNEVAEGLILTCQAHPTSAAITIDYDDI